MPDVRYLRKMINSVPVVAVPAVVVDILNRTGLDQVVPCYALAPAPGCAVRHGQER